MICHDIWIVMTCQQPIQRVRYMASNAVWHFFNFNNFWKCFGIISCLKIGCDSEVEIPISRELKKPGCSPFCPLWTLVERWWWWMINDRHVSPCWKALDLYNIRKQRHSANRKHFMHTNISSCTVFPFPIPPVSEVDRKGWNLVLSPWEMGRRRRRRRSFVLKRKNEPDVFFLPLQQQ